MNLQTVDHLAGIQAFEALAIEHRANSRHVTAMGMLEWCIVEADDIG